MGFISRMLALGNRRSDDFTMDDYIKAFLSGDDLLPPTTSSGATVSSNSALGVSAVYGCVNIISSVLASLPLFVYERTDQGKNRVRDDLTYKLLHDQPNKSQTSFDWRRLTAVHQLLWGAGISEIEFDKQGFPVALWPIPPWRVTVLTTQDRREPVYEIKLPDGRQRRIPQYRTVVFPAMGTSIFEWKSPITVHRETIGLAMAMKEFGAKTFGQGTNPAGIVYHPGKLSVESEDSLRKSMQGYAGLSQSHRLMLLEDGMKWERVGLPPEDAQYLESQSWSVSEIARIYNVPLHLLQSHEKSTSWGSGLEELNAGFVTITLRPYLVQWEQEINRRLIFVDNRFCEFLVEGLLRGKLKERYEAYAIGRTNGWLSANDIRSLENMNRINGNAGDDYLVPLNMTTAGTKPDEGKQDGGKKDA